jgi:hypothetical protein
LYSAMLPSLIDCRTGIFDGYRRGRPRFSPAIVTERRYRVQAAAKEIAGTDGRLAICPA